MSKSKNDQSKKSATKSKQEKTATNNQWTNANLPTNDDNRERRDGPGGDCGCGR